MPTLMYKLVPIAVIAFSISSINTFIDALYVGQFLGETALAGLSLAFPLTLIINAFAAMLGIGGSSLLSISLGANEVDTQKKILGVSILMSGLISLILIFIGIQFSETMIELMGGTGEVLAFGAKYIKILLLFSAFQLMALVMNFLIRAEGKIKTAMIMTISSVLLNIILNPIFIKVLGMGIEGAAYATICSMVFLMFMGAGYFLLGKPSYPVDIKYLKLDKNIIKPICAVGVSAMMLQVMFLVQNVVTFKMISIYGDDWEIAFMGACYRCVMLMIIPGFGFSVAVQPVIGMNYGAQNYERVKRAFYYFAGGSTLLTAFLLIIFNIYPVDILSLLLPNSNFTDEDIFHFRIMISPIFISSFFVVTLTLYQSIGRAKVSGVMTVLREIIFFVPVVIFLPQWIGITGIYAAGIFQNVIALIIICVLLRGLFKELDINTIRTRK